MDMFPRKHKDLRCAERLSHGALTWKAGSAAAGGRDETDPHLGEETQPR